MEEGGGGMKAIAKTEAAAPAWTAEDVDTIRRTVAVGATDSELKMFLHLSRNYGLDPLAKDLWFIKAGGRPVIMTSRDGYLKIANRDPNFDGMEADVVYSGDDFRKTKDGVEHTYGTQNRGTPIGAYALVWRTDRKTPAYVFAPFRDYNKGSGTWRQYPHAMILKVAEAMALKRAFSISGLVTKEELGEDGGNIEPRHNGNNPAAPNNSRRANEIWQRYLAACNGDAEAAKTAIQKIAPTPSRSWMEDDFNRLEAFLAKITEEQEPVVDAEVVEDAATEQETPPEPTAEEEPEAAEEEGA